MDVPATPDELFRRFDQRLRDGAAELSHVSATFLFDLDGDGSGKYHLIVERGHGSAGPGDIDTPDLTFEMSGATFASLRTMDEGVFAFMNDQLMMRGDESLALALAPFWFEETSPSAEAGGHAA
jgi:hypothetical protein